jgi:hypothetical protein
MKTAAVLKQVADRKKAVNEKNASTALDKTVDDIQETRDDNACDDDEEEDDEEEEHGKGRAASGVQRKRRQERSFYFTREEVKRIHSKEGGILTAMFQVGGHVECKKTITMPNGDTQGVLQHFWRCHPALNLKIRALNLTPSSPKNPPNFMTLLNQDVPSHQEVHNHTLYLRTTIYVTRTHEYLHTTIYVTNKHQYLSLEHTNIERVDCRLTVPHTCQILPTINQLLISTVY